MSCQPARSLDLHHEIFLRMLSGRLHDAPIGKQPQRILDIGTGTGIWAIDMADTYPSAEVIGTDLT
jgi:methylase of polypeptide subunit release factors